MSLISRNTKAMAPAVAGILIVAVLVVVVVIQYPDLLPKVESTLRQSTPLPVFLLLFALLPLVGFPISVLCVMAGARLGLGWGLAVLVLLMPLHLAGTLAISRLLRTTLSRMLDKRGISLPQLPDKGRISWMTLFSLIPGLSYTIKNYVLCLAGVKLRDLLLVVWPVQALQCAPLVLVGGSVSTGSIAPLVGGVLLFIAFLAAIPNVVRALQRAREKKARKSEAFGNDHEQS